MKKMKRFLSILLIVAIGSSLLVQQNVYAGIADGDISEHDQAIISAKKYAKKAFKQYAQESVDNANRVIAALRLACNVFDATGSVDLTREAFADYLGGEKGFIWVNDDGSYALTKELIDEFKAFIKANAGGVHGSNTTYLPYLIRTMSNEDKYVNMLLDIHANSWYNGGIKNFKESGGISDAVSRSGVSSYDFALLYGYWEVQYTNVAFVHDLPNSKYNHFYFVVSPSFDSNGLYKNFDSDVGSLKCYNSYTGQISGIMNPQSGITDYQTCVKYNPDNTVELNSTYGSMGLLLKKYDDYTFDAYNIVSTNGNSYLAFTSNDHAKAYFNSMTSYANSAGITINNYNKIYKYVNDDKPSGFIVVSPDDDMDVEPTDYTFDTPTDPGDSGGGSDSGGGASTEDSSGIIKAINNLYDMLEKKLDKIISQLRYNNIIDTVELFDDIVLNILTKIEQTITNFSLTFRQNVKEIGGMCQKKFPLSIPFDILIIIKLLKAEPVTPKFEIPFKNKSSLFPIDEKLTIDFSIFDDSIVYMRIFILLVYCYGLLMLTLRVVRSNTYIDAN